MDKNLATITIENYDGKKIIYTMPDTANIESCRSMIINGENAGLVTYIAIEVNCPEGIDITVEDYIK